MTLVSDDIKKSGEMTFGRFDRLPTMVICFWWDTEAREFGLETRSRNQSQLYS